MVMGASRLGAAYPQRLLFPVRIIEPQASDLAGTQPVGDQLSEGQPTGIAIVNPTEESQEITIRFYQSGIPPLDIRESVLTIPRQSKVSRYLSDLVDLEGLEDTLTPLRKHNAGVVRIQGETEIAVAAVQVSEATQWFQTVLVSPEPKGR